MKNKKKYHKTSEKKLKKFKKVLDIPIKIW